MYGEVADLQQRSAYVQEFGFGVHHVGRTHNDAACDGERAVEPSAHDGAAIDFCVEAHDAALSRHLRVGLDAEGW